MQLCPYMVAARLMTLLWPGPDTPTKNYPQSAENDMPGFQRCFFGALDYLQQAHPHIPELRCPPPRITHQPAPPRQLHNATHPI